MTPAALIRKVLRGSLLVAALTVCGALHGEVRWLDSVHNFGAFDEEDGSVSCTFRMVNKGPDEVSVRSARASCGCTAPHYPHEAIAPGDTASITVTYNPTGRPGRFAKTVKITLSDQSVQTLTIKGVVIGSQNTLRSRYPIEAGRIKLRNRQVPFGTVYQGKAKSAYLEIYNSSHEPLHLSWRNVPAYLRITAAQDTVAPGEQGVYSMVLTPSKSDIYGILTDSVELIVPGDPDPVKIDLTAIVEEDFSRLTPGQRANAPVIAIEPERVDFGEFPGEGTIALPFEILNRGKSDLLIRRAYTIDPGITVSLPSKKVKKGKRIKGTVTVDPGQLPTPLLNARIQIISNDPDNPLAILRVVGIPAMTGDL